MMKRRPGELGDLYAFGVLTGLRGIPILSSFWLNGYGFPRRAPAFAKATARQAAETVDALKRLPASARRSTRFAGEAGRGETGGYAARYGCVERKSAFNTQPQDDRPVSTRL
jgi:hypothetical protein